MIRIDARERDLISLIQSKYGQDKTVVEALTVGDFIIEKNETEKVIIERKSLADLLASIKDGRYNEQSYRLNGYPIHNHNIIYLIEGDLSKIRNDREKQMIQSAIFSLNYFKGFSIMRTSNKEETATYICNCAIKMVKKEERGFFCEKECQFSIDANNNIEQPQVYSSVVKQVKKENVTPENIGEIMLCQIPGVSSTAALAIMKQFKYFPNLIADLQEQGEACLKSVSWENSKGQTKKLNAPCCANIVKYLT
jgi:ERCC4-type nuclease